VALEPKANVLLQSIGRTLTKRGYLSTLFDKHTKILVVFSIFILLYLGTIILVPTPRATLHRYHLTADSALVVNLSVSLPAIAIWLVALIGYVRLRDYSDTIELSPDGKAFRLISSGIFYLTLWLPLSGLISNAEHIALISHRSQLKLIVYIDNYVNIIILIAAITLVYKGSRQLLKVARQKEQTIWEGVLVYAVFAGLYTYLVFQDPGRQVSMSPMIAASYYTPDWLTMLTIIIPRLIMWYMGFQAAFNVFMYRRHVSGKIYRKSLTSLALGIAGVTATIAVLRSLQTLTAHVLNWDLPVLLAVIYGLLILIAIGYALISRGAGNLKRIENV